MNLVSTDSSRGHIRRHDIETAEPEEPLVDIALEPWDIQEYVLKRVFDVVFAASGLFVLIPVIVVIAVAIKLDSPGQVLYQQDRTATFGETFSVYKFRSMIPDAEAETGVKLSEEDTGGIDPRDSGWSISSGDTPR